MGKSFAEWEFQVQSAFMAQGLYSLLCTEVPIRTKADHDRTGRGKYILIRSIDQDLWSDCEFSSARTVLFDPFTTAKACYEILGACVSNWHVSRRKQRLQVFLDHTWTSY
jgi:hypothetical protein